MKNKSEMLEIVKMLVSSVDSLTKGENTDARREIANAKMALDKLEKTTSTTVVTCYVCERILWEGSGSAGNEDAEKAILDHSQECKTADLERLQRLLQRLLQKPPTE